jgi:hypothetical protein
MSVFRLRHKLRTRIWLIALLSLVAALVMAIVTLAIDRANDYGLVSQSVTGSAPRCSNF